MATFIRLFLILSCLLPVFSFAQEGDAKATTIAEQVMTALGGRDNYDQTRYLTWRFFGKRFHVWDKYTGDIRVEDGKGLVVLMNVNSNQGRAWQDGQKIEEAEALKEKMEWGYSVWINDSYWVVMPYKLQDPGVVLRHARVAADEEGHTCDVLTLTFEEVGLTPENKYEVYVDQQSHLVTQWAFFEKAADPEPRFVNPWRNWHRHGRIMLSDDRGKWQHTDLAVLEQVPAGVFEDPGPVNLFPEAP